MPATMAETTPAPINHNDAAAKPPMPVDPNAMSESRAMTKKAMGKGTSRGWIARELVPETAGNSAVIVVHPSGWRNMNVLLTQMVPAAGLDEIRNTDQDTMSRPRPAPALA